MAPHFNIAEDAWPLIQSAVRFGDRIAELSFVTNDQRRAIAATKEALRRLPDVTLGPRREYELMVTSSERAAFLRSDGRGPTPEPTLHLSFDVEYWSRDGIHRVGIGGVHLSPERGSSPEEEFAGDEYETWYEVCTSGVTFLDKPSHPEAAHGPWWQTWAQATENPASYLAIGVTLEVIVTLGQHTWVAASDGYTHSYDWSEYEWWKGDEP